MLKKSQRVKHKKDFNNIFKKGKSAFDKIVGIKTLSNQTDFKRFGVIVSKKVSKSAVVRNKLKRQIKSILGAEEPSLKTGFDSIVFTQKDIINKNYQEIKEALLRLFKNNKLY